VAVPAAPATPSATRPPDAEAWPPPPWPPANPATGSPEGSSGG
jgi:hypothetical protein